MSTKISYNCPKCFAVMENLGNINGMVVFTIPPTFETVHICRKCRVRKIVMVKIDTNPAVPPDIEEYERIP